MPYLEANGERLYYEDHGQGAAVLFLHSLGSSSHAWREQVRGLRERYRVVVMDRRGHGRSSHNGALTLDTGVDDAVALLTALGIERATVCGLSMGGTEAMRLYERYPERVSALVLCDTFAELPPEQAEARLAELRARLREVGMAGFARRYADDNLRPHTPEAVKEELVGVMGSMSEASYLAAAEAVFQARLGHVPPTIQVPTLVIVGEHDPRTTVERCRELAGQIPGARFHVIADAGHLSNLDQPDAFNRVITGFLAEVLS